MGLEANRMAELAGRPLGELSRRDVGIALLSVPAEEALASLPGLRRALLAAGNPLSAPFWHTAEAILAKISDHEATVGDVHGWLEATGTEPTAIIGLHVWEEPANRSPLQDEMHGRLVRHLEERLAAGDIDPDQLAEGDDEARRAYLAIQERWMTSALPDGRVPMNVLLDEQDEAFLADWEAAEADALTGLRSVLDAAGERPLPKADLETAAAKLRADVARPGWPGQMLVSFSGRHSGTLPGDDGELWLALAASVASPQGDPLSDADREYARAMEWAEDEPEPGDEDEPGETAAALAAVCALDHDDWLAVITALVNGGPGTAASAADLARYVRDYDPSPSPAGFDADDADADAADDDFDELSIEGLFLHVTAMWSVLGAIDDDDRLTALGWWGLPEAMRQAWSG
ncbi:MAG: hypothetical protein FWE35_21290 [Streptosporangiales bacterium]|nr:hypothetical protein [Streptosporangiales bacterium]